MKLLLLIFASTLSAAITNVRVEPSHAQAVIYYTAPDTSACSVLVYDMNLPVRVVDMTYADSAVTVTTALNHGFVDSSEIYVEGTGVSAWNGQQTVLTVQDNKTFLFSTGDAGSASTGTVGLLVNDTNNSLFANSHLDSRSGSANSGRLRQFIAGTRRSEISNGVSYSRSLQTNSRHRYVISCGADTATGEFYTRNIPMGRLNIDRPIPAAPGASAWPTLDKAGRWEKSSGVFLDRIIDPLTGVLYTPMYPPEITYDTSFSLSTTNTPTPVGANWTNPGNVRTQDATSATYSSATQDPLVVRPYKVFISTDSVNELGANRSAFYTQNYSLESVKVTIRGAGATSASSDNRSVEIALSNNGGVSPATNWQTVVLPETTLGDVSFPAGTPKGGFGDWHSATQRRFNLNDVVTKRMYVDASGTAVTLRPETGSFTWPSNFSPPDWVSGSKLRIGGSTGDACTSGTEYDIASVQSPRALTLQSSAGTVSNTWACAANFAIMIRKKTTSTDQITIDYVNFTIRFANNPAGHDSGSAKIFSEKPVTDGDGNVGYLSVSGGVGGTNQTIHWVSKDNGESRFIMGFLTNLPGKADPNGWTSGICAATENSFLSSEPEAFICLRDANTGGGKVVVKYKIWWDGTGKWKSQTPSGTPFSTCTTTSPASPNPCLEATNVMGTYTLNDLITARNADYDGTKYTCGIRGVQSHLVVLNCSRSVQDTVAWIVAFDLDKPIGSYNPSDQTTNPVIGALSTTSPYLQGGLVLHTGWVMPGSDRYIAFNPKFGRKNGATNSNGAGPWRLAIVGDAALNNTTDIYTCPANDWGYTDCSDIHVTSHPFDPDPGAGETGAAGEYGTVQAGYGVLFWKCNSADPNYLGYETYSTNEGYNGAGCYTYASENGRVLSVSGTAPDITLVVARRAVPAQTAKNHAAGYSLYLWPINDQGQGMADVSVLWDVLAAPTGSAAAVKIAYAALGHGAFMGHSWVGNLSYTGYGNVVYPNPTPDTIATTPTVNLNLPATWPTFAGKLGNRYGNDIQNYNANNHSDFPAARESAYQFYFDSRPWMSMLIQPTHFYWEKVSGGTYLYRYNKMADGPTQYPYSRHLPLLVFGGPYLTTEISGVSSVLNDNTTDHWKMCVVERADECVTGSKFGEVYANLPYAYTTGTADYRCFTGVYAWNEADICTEFLDPMLGPNIQYIYGSSEGNMARGRHIRKLGNGLVEHKFVNKVPKVYPNGEWAGPLWTNWLNMHRSSGGLMMKLPPVPPDDGIDRTTFVPLRMSTGSAPGGTVVAQLQYGYTDFGTASQFYCTIRKEACLATTDKVIGDALVTSPWTTSNTNATWQYTNSTVSATTPIQITFTSNHKLTADVRLRGHSATTSLNTKLWPITIVDSDTIELTGSNNGDVTAGSTARVMIPKLEAPFAFEGDTFSVAGATNASPIEITTTSMHRYQTGSRVCLSGIGGNTAANGCFTVTATGPCAFTLDSSTGNGAYTSGGTVVPGGVPCASGCTVTIPGLPGYVAYYRWRYLDSTGAVIATGNTNTTVVP